MGWSVGHRAKRTAREPRAPTRATRVRDADARAVMSADASTRRFKIYTKTGDAGTSALYNRERREKDDAAFDALGDVDECNVACGIAREFCVDENNGLEAQVRRRRRQNAREADEATTRGERRLTGTTNRRDAQLAEIQSRLLDVGSAVATPLCGSSDAMKARAAFSETHVETLEGWIDGMDAELPALSSFLLVSGGKASVFLHQARVVCRRAERRCVPLVRSGAVPDVVRVYLNRLSDYMFTAARFAAMKAGREEEAYKKSTAN